MHLSTVPHQVSYSEQQLTELQQQLEGALLERSQAAAELASAAAAAADARGQLTALQQQASGREQQLKEATDKVCKCHVTQSSSSVFKLKVISKTSQDTSLCRCGRGALSS